MLGDAVVTGAEVLSLRRVEAGARVTWRGPDGAVREEVAPRVLLALPAPVLAGLDTDFSAERRVALAGLHYSQAAKLAFLAERRFWEEDAAIYGGISWTGRDATQVWYPSHGFHAEKGVLVGAYIWDDDVAVRFAGLVPEARAAAMAADGAVLHPGYAREVSAPVSVAWARMPRRAALGRSGRRRSARANTRCCACRRALTTSPASISPGLPAGRKVPCFLPGMRWKDLRTSEVGLTTRRARPSRRRVPSWE